MFERLLREGERLTAEHTLEHFRQEHYAPGAAIDRTQVRGDGRCPDLRRRAHAEVQRRLRQCRPPEALSDDQVRSLQEVMRAAAGDFPIEF